MDAISEMKLLHYSVDKLSYELNKSFNFNIKQQVKIDPTFKRDISKIDTDNFIITLCVNVSKKNNNIPFYAEVQISGTFNFKNWENADKRFISYNNSTAILFPYLRSLLSSITTTGNIPPYFLPIMNVSRLFPETD